MNVIEVKNIKKHFKKPVRKTGVIGMAKTLFSRKYTVTKAVDDISFNIQEGEIVGYIGANGAGKSTTIKMMSGILTPTEGYIKINGYEPYDSKQRKHVLNNIGVVFGQKTQLWWDLPLIESLFILKEIYGVSKADYDARMTFLNDILDISSFLNQPIRTLSLGQRIRADLAASLIHNPKILFLDEPTIGLDVLVKDKMIDAIRQINKMYNTTIILTTHNMEDITELCNRVIILDDGKLLYDGGINQIKHKFGDIRNISFTSKDFSNEEAFIKSLQHVDVKTIDNYMHLSFDVNHISVNEVLSNILNNFNVLDIQITENPLESIVKKIYENKQV